MESFLVNSAILSSVKRLLRASKTADIAVAFWGKDAPKRLGLTRELVRSKRVRLICNLNLGGTNPKAIENLRSWLKKAKSKQSGLKQLDWLHAKVYLFDNVAIVGSANASASGLTLEGEEAVGLREAALMTTDRRSLRGIRKWFDDTWSASEPVKDEDLSWAHARWTTRQRVAAYPRRKAGDRAEYFKDKNLNVTWFGQYMTPDEIKAGRRLTPKAFRAIRSRHKDFLAMTDAEYRRRLFKKEHIYLMFHANGNRVTEEGIAHFPLLMLVPGKNGMRYAYYLSYEKSEAIKALKDYPGLRESLASPVIQAIKRSIRQQVRRGKRDGAMPLFKMLQMQHS